MQHIRTILQKNDNFIVENVKVIKIVIAVCTCIIGAIWLLFCTNLFKKKVRKQKI